MKLATILALSLMAGKCFASDGTYTVDRWLNVTVGAETKPKELNVNVKRDSETFDFKFKFPVP